jgi:hypothetical protein
MVATPPAHAARPSIHPAPSPSMAWRRT